MSDELENQLRAARRTTQLPWPPERHHFVGRGLQQRYVRNKRIHQLSAVAVAVTLVLAALYLQLPKSPSESVMQTHIFADGSRADTFSQDTLIETQILSTDELQVVLKRGRARFHVTHQPRRTFRVKVESVDIEVLGTVFDVRRNDPDERVDVSVQEGSVRVRTPTSENILHPGQKGSFLVKPSPPANPPVLQERTDTNSDDAPLSTAKNAKQKPKSKILNGSLRRIDNAVVHDALEKADAALHEENYKDAASLLRNVLRDYPSDPGAIYVAFELGRILTDHLRQPAEGAKAFAKAQSLGLSGPLVEDALAREIDALLLARALKLATDRLALYQKLYPQGTRREEFQRRLAEIR